MNKTDICKFKTSENIPCYEFCLGSVSKDIIKDKKNEILLNCTVSQLIIM